jgi:hypothetical protein
MKVNVWRWVNNVTSSKIFSFTILKSGHEIILLCLAAISNIYTELE